MFCIMKYSESLIQVSRLYLQLKYCNVETIAILIGKKTSKVLALSDNMTVSRLPIFLTSMKVIKLGGVNSVK